MSHHNGDLKGDNPAFRSYAEGLVAGAKSLAASEPIGSLLALLLVQAFVKELFEVWAIDEAYKGTILPLAAKLHVTGSPEGIKASVIMTAAAIISIIIAHIYSQQDRSERRIIKVLLVLLVVISSVLFFTYWLLTLYPSHTLPIVSGIAARMSFLKNHPWMYFVGILMGTGLVWLHKRCQWKFMSPSLWVWYTYFALQFAWVVNSFEWRW